MAPPDALEALAAGCDWTDWSDPNIAAILEPGNSFDGVAWEMSRAYAEANLRASMSAKEWAEREAEKVASAAGKAPKPKSKKAKQEALLI